MHYKNECAIALHLCHAIVSIGGKQLMFLSFGWGRQAQLAMLEQWVMQDCCRLIAIVGIGAGQEHLNQA